METPLSVILSKKFLPPEMKLFTYAGWEFPLHFHPSPLKGRKLYFLGIFLYFFLSSVVSHHVMDTDRYDDDTRFGEYRVVRVPHLGVARGRLHAASTDRHASL